MRNEFAQNSSVAIVIGLPRVMEVVMALDP
jgi:hypothetical protein